MKNARCDDSVEPSEPFEPEANEADAGPELEGSARAELSEVERNEDERAGEAEEEDEATRRDREGGQQFGKALIALGVLGGFAGWFLLEDLNVVGGAMAVTAFGAAAHRWPVAIVRIFTGMGDKL